MKQYIIEVIINNFAPMLITAVLGALGVGTIFVLAMRTLKKVGEFLIGLANALEDRKLTKAEIMAIKASVLAIISIWRKTPKVDDVVGGN